jgi:hypothetical protein
MSFRPQTGAVLPLVIVSMAALLIMIGLAVDVGHLMLNKSRLQNTVDAAALAAAKAYDETANTSLANVAALQAFRENSSAAGNLELGTRYNAGSIQITVQYSATLPPFTPGATGPYVRVVARGFAFPAWLVQLAGIERLSVSASAVAGPSPSVNTACNIAPVMVCGNPNAGAAGSWGYQLNAPQVLKSASPGSSDVGPGNFQLLRLDGSGANILRQQLAGGYQACMVRGAIANTQPGTLTGPVAQGINTRFGQYSGSMSPTDYPPDVLTTSQNPPLTVDNQDRIWQGSTQITAANLDQLLYSYSRYVADEANPASYDNAPITSGGIGVFHRRILAVPVGDCSATKGGATAVPVIGLACYFLLQPAIQKGSSDYLIGQFIRACEITGEPGPIPDAGPGPYVIQLYHDPGSGDS